MNDMDLLTKKERIFYATHIRCFVITAKELNFLFLPFYEKSDINVNAEISHLPGFFVASLEYGMIQIQPK